ncbi:hypothetical protein B6K86_02040 [Lachnospiraceae bacterium]|nr:hypothetical protein B6K86_02040 [Lachnospiraceae bacterium]
MHKVIENRSELKEWLEYEKKRYGYVHGIAGVIFPITEKDVLMKHQIRLRKTEFYHNTGHRLMEIISKILLSRLQNQYSIHIPINTCGRGLLIMHVGPVLINWHASIGEDATFHINTSIVSNSSDGTAPSIGHHLFLGVGATVSGNIKLGNYCVVGAGAVVNKSFERDDITIAGIPSKIIKEQGCLNWGK